ncbi:MAG: hypothetical protein IJM44_04775, partial [Ruminococcus sp.]|nr:hypothetical protein [Ruminococcus sp.]
MKRSEYRRALDGIKLSDDFRTEMERRLSQPAQRSIEMDDYTEKVDHLERVPKRTWRSFAATAAAFAIVGGTAGGIAYRLHNMPDNRHEITEGMIETPFGSFGGFTLWMCEYSWGEMPEIAVDTFVNWLDSNNWEKVDLDSEDWEGVDIKSTYCGDGVTIHGIGGDEQTLYFSTYGCAVESKDGEYSLYTFDGGDYTNWYADYISTDDNDSNEWWSYYSLERALVYLAPYFDLTDVELDNTFQDLTDECESYIKEELLANADSLERLDEQETADRTAMLMSASDVPVTNYVYGFHWAIGFSDDDVISVFYYNNPAAAPEGYPYNAAYYKAPEGLCTKMQSAIQNRLPGASNCPLEKHSGFTSALASASEISETDTIALTEQEAEDLANWFDTLDWSIETKEYKDSANVISFSLDDERLYFFDNGYVCYNTIDTAKYYLMSGSEYIAAYDRICSINGMTAAPADPQTLINRVIDGVQLAYLCEDDLVTGKYSANIP